MSKVAGTNLGQETITDIPNGERETYAGHPETIVPIGLGSFSGFLVGLLCAGELNVLAAVALTAVISCYIGWRARGLQ